MTATGRVFRSGEVAHHVVAQGLTDKFSTASRELLGRLQIGIDEAVNGAKIPAWYHQGAGNFLHDEKFTKMIYDRLSNAAKDGADAVRKELKGMGKAIEKAAKETKTCVEVGSHINRC